MMDKHLLLQKLRESAAAHKPIAGAAIGCGLFAKYAEAGGADFILVLNAGRFRLMGFGSPASLLPLANSNQLVMDIGTSEVLRSVDRIPCLFGLRATDPSIRLDHYLEDIRQAGFAGITNFPTVGLIDGKFGEALEESGISFSTEVEAIRLASAKGMFTVAFVFQEGQAVQMARAGADVDGGKRRAFTTNFSSGQPSEP